MGGLFFEDLEPGAVHRHPVRRTVTEMDNVLFTTLTLNLQPLHLDDEFSKGTFYGQRVMNSLFTLGLVTGIAATDMTLGTTLGNLGFKEVTFPAPVFHGDTLRAETEVEDKRESKSRPDAGIVHLRHTAYNQRDELVCDARRVALMRKRP